MVLLPVLLSAIIPLQLLQVDLHWSIETSLAIPCSFAAIRLAILWYETIVHAFNNRSENRTLWIVGHFLTSIVGSCVYYYYHRRPLVTLPS